MKKVAIVALALLGAASVAQAAGDADAGKAKSTTCAACHGADGNSMVGTFPKLAQQGAPYIMKQLHDFQSGARKDPTMTGMAAPLSAQDIEDLAAYFSSQSVAIGSADPAKAKLGEKLYRGGDKTNNTPACMACHGPDGAGNYPAKFPSLRGQQHDYVVKQLKAFKDGTRSNDPNSMMRDVAAKLSDKQIEDLAQYISGLH